MAPLRINDMPAKPRESTSLFHITSPHCSMWPSGERGPGVSQYRARWSQVLSCTDPATTFRPSVRLDWLGSLVLSVHQLYIPTVTRGIACWYRLGRSEGHGTPPGPNSWALNAAHAWNRDAARSYGCPRSTFDSCFVERVATRLPTLSADRLLVVTAQLRAESRERAR